MPNDVPDPLETAQAPDVPPHADAPQTRREAKQQREGERKHHRVEPSPPHHASRPIKKRRRWLAPVISIVVVVVIIVAAAGISYVFFQPQVKRVAAIFFPPANFQGDGEEKALFTITEGDTGLSISQRLHAEGITASVDGFYSLLLSQRPAVVFEPGVFRLAKRMSDQAVLNALKNPSNRVQYRVTIPEGTKEANVLIIASERTGVPLSELQAASTDLNGFGLPAQARSLEGYLFPATYTFTPGVTAHQILSAMVTRMWQALATVGITPANSWNTIVLASIVQSEGKIPTDFPKIARVFVNRLAQGWPLQSDATVQYGLGGQTTVETTPQERADASNPYNTYAHTGLPVGPISNPGQVALDAAVNPAPGPWLFFVTWNLATGETIFSTTQAEQNAAIQKWQQWMKENPGYE